MRTPIDDYLAKQRLLTPVARFAGAHEAGTTPAMESVYRDLIPLSMPTAGEQYAFEVDLDACSGCKACVAACHSLNGLEDDESWRDVGLLQGQRRDGSAYLQTITSACHHCVDPACLEGCPVLAYEKDPITGIVHHLDDQCIGCQYCVLKCPYEVPKYSEQRGIVRKCDMCHQRLAEGEAPACVQACPTSAIRIVLTSTHAAEARAAAGEFLPESPDPRITTPTTRFVSRREVPAAARAADTDSLRVQPTHGPLVATLVGTQAATGMALALALTSHRIPATAHTALALGTTLVLFTALAASVFHLGQPLKAWRFFLGLRRSWLSREILAFNAAAGLASAVAAERLGWLPAGLPNALPTFLPWALAGGLGVAVFTSVMIYVDTRRPWWDLGRVSLRFFGSVLGLGLVAAAWVLAAADTAASGLFLAGGFAAALKLIAESVDLLQPESPAARRAARIQLEKLRLTLLARLACGGVGIVFAVLAGLGAPAHLAGGLALLGLAVGELLERVLFFRAVPTRKMPGHFET